MGSVRLPFRLAGSPTVDRRREPLGSAAKTSGKTFMDGAGVPAQTIASLKKAFAKAIGKRGPGALDRLESQFVDQALEDYAADETPELTPDDLAAVLADFWRFGRDLRRPRRPGHPAAPGQGRRRPAAELRRAGDRPGRRALPGRQRHGRDWPSRASRSAPCSTRCVEVDRATDGRARRRRRRARESMILVLLDPIGAGPRARR